tara:strand:+ start:2459 stop:2677 length:219 start_codon:yes stop_codon:yes gene_type:complete
MVKKVRIKQFAIPYPSFYLQTKYKHIWIIYKNKAMQDKKLITESLELLLDILEDQGEMKELQIELNNLLERL